MCTGLVLEGHSMESGTFGIAILFWFRMVVYVGGYNPGGVFCASWYCFQSQCSLVLGMVMRCRPFSSYMWATSKCVWIVFWRFLCLFRGYIHG